jgi:mRNA interferase MazF
MGLITDSVIVADNIATIHEREIDKVLGHRLQMPEVDAVLRQTACDRSGIQSPSRD